MFGLNEVYSARAWAVDQKTLQNSFQVCGMEVIQKCQLSGIALPRARFFQSDSIQSLQAQSHPPWIWTGPSVVTVALPGSSLVYPTASRCSLA